MAGYLRPRRGKLATATSQNIVLKRGEVFFEVPTGGVGTGAGKIKMGDGTTAYSALPYFLEPTAIDVAASTIAFTEASSTDNSTLLSAIASGAQLKTIIGNVKKLLRNLDSSVTQLNNDLGDKLLYGTNITDILQITTGGLYHSKGDCPNAPTTEGSYYNYFASRHDGYGWLISVIAINCSYKSELYTSVIRTDDGINWHHGGWNKLIDNYTFSDLVTESDRSFKIRTESWWSNVDESYTDANNIIINGCGSTIGGSYTNLPSDSDGWGTLYCFSNGTNIVQLYFGWNAGQLWYRTSHQDYGNWSQWINLNSVAATANAAYDKVVALESKFNNLFTQDGNTLTINY